MNLETLQANNMPGNIQAICSVITIMGITPYLHCKTVICFNITDKDAIEMMGQCDKKYPYHWPIKIRIFYILYFLNIDFISGYLKFNINDMNIIHIIFIITLLYHFKVGDSVAKLSCSIENEKKMVFVHVFKCGGSTIRRILRSYSKLCTVSLATLTECKFNSEHKAEGSRNRHVFPCKLKDFYLPSNPDFSSERAIIKISDKTSVIRNPHVNFINKFDIIQGHVHYDMEGLPSFDTSYITWLRNPLSMLVSASMYVLSEEINGLSETALYNKIFDDLERRVVAPKHVVGSEKVYSMYAYYFLNESSTDLQHIKSATIVDKVKNNLKHFQTIGVLENQQVSIAMLRMLIDTRDDLSPQFWKSATKVQRNTQQSNLKHNITSSSVIETLKASRGALWTKILRCLESEYQIYEYALDLHINSCKLLVKTENERFSEFILASSPDRSKDNMAQNVDICTDALSKLLRYAQLTNTRI